MPGEFASVVVEVTIDGQRLSFTVGLYSDGRPGVILAHADPHGETLDGLLRDWGIAASRALQAGVPIEEIASTCRGTRYPPSGSTSDPTIPEATSPLDYLARWCLRRWPLA